jgi:hypothetical protein
MADFAGKKVKDCSKNVKSVRKKNKKSQIVFLKKLNF